MRKSALIKVATQSILKNKLRMFLTMLGIMIGVAAVIVMVAIGSGARSTIQKQVGNLGTNMIFVMPGASGSGGVSQGAGTYNRLTLQDADNGTDRARPRFSSVKGERHAEQGQFSRLCVHGSDQATRHRQRRRSCGASQWQRA